MAGAYVSELLLRLESLVADGDAWGAADFFAKDVGPLETDGDTKLATGVCKEVDESPCAVKAASLLSVLS